VERLIEKRLPQVAKPYKLASRTAVPQSRIRRRCDHCPVHRLPARRSGSADTRFSSSRRPGQCLGHGRGFARRSRKTCSRGFHINRGQARLRSVGDTGSAIIRYPYPCPPPDWLEARDVGDEVRRRPDQRTTSPRSYTGRRRPPARHGNSPLSFAVIFDHPMHQPPAMLARPGHLPVARDRTTSRRTMSGPARSGRLCRGKLSTASIQRVSLVSDSSEAWTAARPFSRTNQGNYAGR